MLVLKRSQLCSPDTAGSIDNADSCITYQGGWTAASPNITLSQDGTVGTVATTHWTTSRGSSFSLSFQGTGISVSAIYPMATLLPLATVSFQVDSSLPVISSTSNSTNPLLPDEQTMFTSLALQPGTHTLTAQLVNEGNFTLNSFIVFGSSNGTSSGSGATSGRNNGSFNNNNYNNHPTDNSLAQGSNAHSNNLTLGLGIGLGVAVFGIFVIISVFIFLWRRKLHKIPSNEKNTLRSRSNSTVSRAVSSSGTSLTIVGYGGYEDGAGAGLKTAEQVAMAEKLRY